MANTLLPVKEQTLTPTEVARLDKRRSRGLMLMVVSGQFALITVVLLLWLVQDVTYAPGWAHPILYYFIVAVLISGISGMSGVYLRRGAPEF
jgi:membrane protein required for beta-lactamase induction